MFLNKPKKIEEHILSHLQTGPVLILDLIEKIKKDRLNTTKQAVYAAIRMLKKNEQIITYKGTVSLSLSWINTMANYFALAKSNYVKGNTTQNSFLDLEDKEKIKYYFNNPIKADVFWAHALYLLTERISEKPVFIYNPHEWFLLTRYEDENRIFKTITKNGRRLLLTAGNNTFLDRFIKNNFDNHYNQYHALDKPLFKINNYYLNIVSDFLIEVWLDQNMSNKIDVFYNKTTSWDEHKLQELKNIIDTEGRMKIIISRNQLKAEKIKKSLKKYFVI